MLRLRAVPGQAIQRLWGGHKGKKMGSSESRGSQFRWSYGYFLVFLLVSFALNYPGRTNADSQFQLIQVQVTPIIGDWHGPITTRIWNLFGPVIGQPSGALLIDCLVFSLFAGVIPRFANHTRYTLPITIADIMLKIALVATAGIIYKDVLLTFLLLSITAIFAFRRPETNSYKSPFCALVLIACLIRPSNFLVGIISLLLFLIITFDRRHAFWRAAIIGTTAFLLAIPLTSYANKVLLRSQDTYSERQLILFDIAGISNRSGTDLFRTEGGWNTRALPSVDRCFTPHQWDSLSFWGQCPQYYWAYDAAVRRYGKAAPIRWWLAAIVHHPEAYLLHRALFVKKLLWTWKPVTQSPDDVQNTQVSRVRHPYYWKVPEKGGHWAIQMWRDSAVASFFIAISDLALAHRIIYLATMLGSLSILYLTWRQRCLPATLAASVALGNFAMLVFFGVSNEGRYLFPTIACSLYGAIILWRCRLPAHYSV